MCFDLFLIGFHLCISICMNNLNNDVFGKSINKLLYYISFDCHFIKQDETFDKNIFNYYLICNVPDRQIWSILKTVSIGLNRKYFSEQ